MENSDTAMEVAKICQSLRENQLQHMELHWLAFLCFLTIVQSVAKIYLIIF